MTNSFVYKRQILGSVFLPYKVSLSSLSSLRLTKNPAWVSGVYSHETRCRIIDFLHNFPFATASEFLKYLSCRLPVLEYSSQKGNDAIWSIKFYFLAAIFPLVLLSGCNATPPLPEVRLVKIVVATSCVNRSDLPVAPKIASNPELQALGDFDLVISIASERLDLLRYSGEQSALLKACVQP